MPPKKYVRTATKKDESPFSKGDATWLLILESPSKCSKIEDFLGSQYKCIASNGHIRTLDGLKSIDIANNYTPRFSIIPTKQDHVNNMRDILAQFSPSNIILATDDDREGEAIAWHICDTFGLPVETTHRIVFHEITQTIIRNAIQNKKIINMDLVYAQFARQVLDVIVGFRISPVLWKYLYNNKDNGLSAGRCQTPALRLVYENDQDKTNITKTHKLSARFLSKNIEFNLSKELEENLVEDFLVKSMKFKHILSVGSPKDVRKDPPIPLNTSRLLQAASNQLRLSPRDTMSLCQVLYQDGHITYMRTENTKYSNDFLDIARSHITSTYGEPYLGNMNEFENKNENNPHEAIRATHLEVHDLPNKYEGKIASLYRLIWTTTLESCMSSARSSVVECRIEAPDSLHYSHIIEIPVFSGWKKLSGDADADEANGRLFYIKSIKDPVVQYNQIESRIAFHNVHSHYTESSLIKKLEDLGIGRPSTFAAIVDTIQDRGYVKKRDLEGTRFSCTEYILENGKVEHKVVEKVAGNEKGKLVIEPIGVTIIEFLTVHFNQLFSYGYTGDMERRLDIVTRDDWHTICSECDNNIQAMIVPIKKASYKIDESHDMIFTKNGPVIRDNGSSSLQSVNKDVKIDIERLKAGEYTLGELAHQGSRILGVWEGKELCIHNGRYGIYAQWGENKKTLSFLKKPFTEIEMEDVTEHLQNTSNKSEANILRVLDEEFSVRTGKYGPYVYYKRADMAKPEFYNIKKFKESFTYCEPAILIQWVRKTHNISV